MTPELEALGRRAVACPHFAPLPGMLCLWRQDAADPWPERLTEDGVVTDAALVGVDLSDPATLGCLLALVREAWSDVGAYCCDLDGYDGYHWVCVAGIEQEAFPYGVGHFHGDDEAAALVAALEAAPCPR